MRSSGRSAQARALAGWLDAQTARDSNGHCAPKPQGRAARRQSRVLCFESFRKLRHRVSQIIRPVSRRATAKSVARDPVCPAEEFKKALAGQSLKDGGRTRARTWDPLIKSQLLYQLSYAPERRLVPCEVGRLAKRSGSGKRCNEGFSTVPRKRKAAGFQRLLQGQSSQNPVPFRAGPRDPGRGRRRGRNGHDGSAPCRAPSCGPCRVP